MLVLSRHANEVIRIGDDIVVSIQRISGNRVIIGIDAPQEVAIRRGELVFDDGPAAADAAEDASETAAEKPLSTSRKPHSGGKPNGRGLAGRVRLQDDRSQEDRSSKPIMAPVSHQVPDWSTSQIS